MGKRKDYGCKVTAPGRGHLHQCDQPSGHPLSSPLIAHWCPTCEHWWDLPEPGGPVVHACHPADCNGEATV